MTCHAFDIDDAKRYGVDSAIILYNLRFWLDHNKANGTHINDGYVWTYNSARAMSELFPYWSSNKIQKLMKKLENDGVIITGNYNKIGCDKTKWYTLPAYSLQPNGSNPSANSLNSKSQSAQPIPDINTDEITDVINTDISLKRNVYFIDELSVDDFYHCQEAMRVLKDLKKSGFVVYDGSLSKDEWIDCENAMRSCDEFDHVGYFEWWLEKHGISFTKKPALTNMLCDVNGIEFDRFYDSTYLQEADQRKGGDMNNKECKTQCVNCAHSFSSDLYDGEVSCRKSREWFENWAYPFSFDTEGECPDYEE